MSTRKYPDDFINKIICGDCLEVMKEMPDKSIDMIITSPPYWGLRDYGFEQIFGGDKDCEHEWGSSQVEHDALRYRGHNANVGSNKNPEIHPGKEGSGGNHCSKCQAWKGQLGLEPTLELYIEHLTEIFNEAKRVLKKEGTLWLNIGDTYNAGRSGGWAGGKEGFSRPDIAPNQSGVNVEGLQPKCLTMIPERLAWSLIQNGWILRNKIIWYKPNAMPSSVTDRFSNKWEYLYMFSKNQRYYFDLDGVREDCSEVSIKRAEYENRRIEQGRGVSSIGYKSDKYGMPARFVKLDPLGKNPGDVFEINTQPFPEAHFAVFPEKLCEKPIKAGCPEDGIVLDPFAGAGTALLVAKEMKRQYIGIDIKQEYCDMCEKRLAQGVL